MEPASASTTTPAGGVATSPTPRMGLHHGLLDGARPLGILLLCVVVSAALALVVRSQTLPGNFLLERVLAGGVLILGTLVGFVLYAIGCRRTLRHAAGLQLTGGHRRAAGVLLALGLSALVTLLPLLLAILIPQHPAP